MVALASSFAGEERTTGVAVGLLEPDGSSSVAVRCGSLRFDEHSFFELGSVGKTFMATLLALLVIDGTVALDTTVGDILGDGCGAIADVRLEELATHTSGLPRVVKTTRPLILESRDPYRRCTAEHLLAELSTADLTGRGEHSYSNAGFDLLGHCLSVAAGATAKQLIEDRVLRPAGMATARCQPCPEDGLAPAKGGLLLGGRRWHSPLVGAGGVDGTIGDVVAWARANLLPASTPLEPAVRMAHEVRVAVSEHQGIGLAWGTQRTCRFHTGGTGRYSSYVAFDPEAGALVLLQNEGTWVVRSRGQIQKRANDWFLGRLAATSPGWT
jgi:D-alanyl-D-alanine-carboxypeptidase/D-alanyl-D-alanine-endopeptidase